MLLGNDNIRLDISEAKDGLELLCSAAKGDHSGEWQSAVVGLLVERMM